MKTIAWLLSAAWLISLIIAVPTSYADVTADNLIKELEQNKNLPDQKTTPAPDVAGMTKSDNGNSFYYEIRLKQEQNELLEVTLLCVVALISLVVVIFNIRKTGPNSADHIVSATGLIFIIQGTIILVLMAKTDQQMTAAIGIIGAVTGYLFGKMQSGPKEI